MAKMLGFGFLGKDDTRASLLFLESLDARPDRTLEEVVREHHHAPIPGDELLGQAQRLGDAACLLLVGVEEAVDPELVSIAEQAQEFARMRPTGDEHDLADSRADKRLDRVADHRAVVDGEQVLVGDACQRVQAAPGAAGKNYTPHATEF